MPDSLPTPHILAEGRYARFVRRGTWEYVERHACRGAVAIIAVTPEHRWVLTEQLRLPVGRRVIELPAGLVGDQAADESMEQAARRELREETGYELGRVELLAHGPPSAGLSSEMVWLVRAWDLAKRGAGGGDASEAIVVHEVPVADAECWLRGREDEGLLVDLKVYAGLYFLTRPA